MQESEYLIGIDGGGSHSQAVLTDLNGNLIAETAGAGLNPLSLGFEQFCVNFTDLFNKLVNGVEAAKIAALCAGLAGTGSAAVQQRARQEISRICGAREVIVISDALAALWGAFQGNPGLLLIAGTGSICLGLDIKGRTARSGGFGRFLGDEGGGYWISLQAIREALLWADGRGGTDRFTEALCTKYRIESILEIVPLLHSGAIPPDSIAEFAAEVLSQAEVEEVVQRIIQAGGDHLADLVIATARKLSLSAPRLVLWGGLWCAPQEPLQKALFRALQRCGFSVKIVNPEETPPWGAIRYLQAQLKNALGWSRES